MAVLAFALALCAPADARTRFTWLHTRYGELFDANGHGVRLTGFNQMGMYEGSAGNQIDACGQRWRPPPATLMPDIQRWGFNSVRLHVSWSDLEPHRPTVAPNGKVVHHWNRQYLAALDHVAADALAHHVYLIPVMTQSALSPAFKRYDGHTCEGSGMPAWLFPASRNKTYEQGWCNFFANRRPGRLPVRPLDGFVAAWRTIARRYAHNRAVAAVDLLNEPGSAFPCARKFTPLPPDYIDAFNRRVGRAIRRVDPRVVLILEDNNFSSGPYGHFITSRAGLRNVIYEWHDYSRSWALVQPQLQEQVAFAQRIGAPLWLGEFDAFNADSNVGRPVDVHWRRDLAAMLAYMRRHGVSWSMENYDGDWSILKPGTDVPKPRLLALLQRGLGVSKPAVVASATVGGMGARPGSAWLPYRRAVAARYG